MRLVASIAPLVVLSAVMALTRGVYAFLVLGWTFALFSAFWRFLASPRAPASGKERDLFVTSDALVAQGGSSLLRRRIRSGYLEPDADEEGASLVLRGRMGRLAVLAFDSIEEARALQDDLGLSPLKRPVTFAFFFGLRVTVGVDGVVVAWPLLRRRRFVPHAKIEEVGWGTDAVRFLLVSGESYAIATGPATGERNRALVERLVQARIAWRESEGVSHVAALARSGRSHEAWIHELCAISETAGAGYRSAALPEDTLWRVVQDPSESVEQRIGASLALRRSLHEAGRARLAIAAEASASPRVRIALVAVAEVEDDARLAELLALER